jgi:hypothetical protein
MTCGAVRRSSKVICRSRGGSNAAGFSRVQDIDQPKATA